MRHKVRWWFSLSYLQHRTAVALILLMLFPAMLAVYAQENDIHMPHQEVEHWAKKIGNHIFHLSNTFTYYNDIKTNFVQGDAKIHENDGLQLVKEMAEDVSNMMQFKVEAVKRIMNVAEEAALDKEHRQDERLEYFNAKKLNEYYTDRNQVTKLRDGYKELTLTPNTHFDGTPVNENVSSVHVPTNVYDKADEVTEAIRWSARLDRTFKSNYELDPTLSWQYFGSSTGFLRQYPASKWVLDEKDPDLYDARLRSWYIQAANSPKDMIILLDVSGSMTGLRREIAKHVVLNILETLNENDFVNVFNFSVTATELVPCFNDTLVQANLENIGVFKKALATVETMEIANFTKALTKAFELLQRYNKSGQGSQCNQAIMLVTDGAPYNFEEIFAKYNWPHLQVRMFTYLIGREETKRRDLKWMACANKGYFVHVTTLAEVREQVLKYIPVMARPMVMYQNNHPHIWTGVYADIAHPRHGYLDPKQTDWLWELRERKRQMDRTNNYRDLKKRVENRQLPNDYIIRDSEKIEKFLEYGEFLLTPRDIARMKAKHNRESRRGRMKRDLVLKPRTIHGYKLWLWYERILREMKKIEQFYEDIRLGRRGAPGQREGYRLMTSVSVPVFDRNKTSNITERVLVNEAVWQKRKREVRTANLLGVAGTDVPIREIEKLVPPYKIGVNGYSFMVNTNGYILYHPDLRPVFQDILKPNYNSVDFAEVELIDQDHGPRSNNSHLMELTKGRDYNTKLRRDLIDQRENESNFTVKIHMDNMKRVVRRQQRYFTQKVDGTPFSLGIAMPEGYGKYKVHGQIELTRAMQDYMGTKPKEYLEKGNWTLHPDWVYCEYKYDQNRPNMTPEDLMLDFLTRAQEPRWKWRSTRTRAPPEPSMTNTQCDKDLVQSLLFDAKATDVYKEKFQDNLSDNHSGRQNFGITTAFVATRSGLTRWLDLTKAKPGEMPEPSDEPHMMQIHNRAIDEVWYKRAVDYHEEDPNAYVYSVPFDAAALNPEDVLVTATRAIFIEENRHRKAPAAVVGVTIKHQKFVEYFTNETYKTKKACPSYPARDSSCKNARTCESDYLDCYLLDDNGFIIASEKSEHTGKFFGTLEGTIMESLVQSEVYQKVKIYDYQAVCLDSRNESSTASVLMTPIQVLRWTANWVVSNIFWVLVKTQLYTLWDPNEAWAYTHGAREAQYPDIISAHGDSIDYKEPIMEDPRYEKVPDYISDEPAEEVVSEIPEVEENVQPDYGFAPEDDRQYPDDYEHVAEDGDFPSLELAYINKMHPRPCDKEVDLYKLQNHKLQTDGAYKPVKGKLSNCHPNGCGRHFSVQKVVSTNLILVAVNNLCSCESSKGDIEPVEVEYNETMLCNRLLLHHYRKRPQECFNYHPEEHEIKQCGGGCSLGLPSAAMLTLLVLAHLCNTLKLQS